MTLAITGLYAAVLGILMMILSVRVSILRGSTGISILHGDNMQLAERMRQHDNFAEAVPMALLLMGIAEMQGAGTTWMHATGAVLLIARLAHPLGINHTRPAAPARIIGSLGTKVAMLMALGFILKGMF